LTWHGAAQDRQVGRQAQAQIRQVAKIIGTDDLQHVNAPARTVDPGFYQAQNQPHPHSPAAETYGWSCPAQHNSPNLAAFPPNVYEQLLM
jgi:hypothetical protein